MNQPLTFTFDSHVYHADVDVCDNGTFDVTELYRWDYGPDGEPRSVDVCPGPFRAIIGRELDKHIASQLVDDWASLLDRPNTRSFADRETNECEYERGNLSFYMYFIPFSGICQLSIYRYDPFTGSWRQTGHLDPDRKASLEKAFKDALDEKYREIDDEEEARKQEKADEYERDYHSDYRPEDAHERRPA